MDQIGKSGGRDRMTKHVIYTLDEQHKPAHFLAIAEDRDELQAKMGKWWKAFETGEKQEPKEYNGISHRPIADFDRWRGPDE